MTDQFDGRMGEAVVMRQYGPPEMLRLERVALAPLAADEIRVRTRAAAINHSDLEIRAGTWPILRPDPFPYTPGLEVIGDVVETGSAVSRFRVGERVVTMMQGLGGVRARRPGGYAEYVVVPPRRCPPISMPSPSPRSALPASPPSRGCASSARSRGGASRSPAPPAASAPPPSA